MVYIQGRKCHIQFMKLENTVSIGWKRVVNALLCPHHKLSLLLLFGLLWDLKSGSLQVLSLCERPLVLLIW